MVKCQDWGIEANLTSVLAICFLVWDGKTAIQDWQVGDSLGNGTRA